MNASKIISDRVQLSHDYKIASPDYDSMAPEALYLYPISLINGMVSTRCSLD